MLVPYQRASPEISSIAGASHPGQRSFRWYRHRAGRGSGMTRPFPVYYTMVDGRLTASYVPFAKVQAPPRKGEQEFARVSRKRTIKPAENSPGVQELES